MDRIPSTVSMRGLGMRHDSPKGTCLVLFVLCLVGVIVYAPSFHVEFQLDDIPVIVKNAHIRHLKDSSVLFRYDPTRFLTHLTFTLNYHWGGLRLFDFHLINFILHFGCAFLVFCLVQRTLALGGKDKRFLVSFLCAFIFLVHPLQTQAVTYIVQRSTLLATFFYLWSLLVYLRLKVHFNWPYYVLSWGLVFLGAVSKPIFVTLPLAVLVYEYYFFQLSWQSFKKNFLFFLPYLLVIILVPFFLLLFSLNYFSEPFDFSKLTYATRVTSEISRWDYFLTQLRVMVTYGRLLFLPVHQNLDYDYSLSHSFWEGAVGLSFLVHVLIFTYAVWMFQKERIVSLAIVWFYFTLIPESSIFPIPDVIFEHRVYLPSVGFALFLSHSLFSLMRDLRRYVFVSALLILSFSILAYARNLVWMDRLGLLKDTVAKSPLKARPHNNLGILFMEQGFLDLAEKEFKAVIQLDDKYVNAYNNLGQLYVKQKRFPEAMEEYKRALELSPSHFEANLNLGNIYYELGQFELAANQYRMALSIRPQSDTACLNLGNIYLQFNNYGDAERFYKMAIANNPRSSLAYYALGNLYLAQNFFDRAIEAYERAITIQADYVDAYNTLGIAYVRSGNPKKAEQSFTRALQLNPDYVIAYLNLAHYYERTGDKQKAEYFFRMAQEIEKRKTSTPNN